MGFGVTDLILYYDGCIFLSLKVLVKGRVLNKAITRVKICDLKLNVIVLKDDLVFFKIVVVVREVDTGFFGVLLCLKIGIVIEVIKVVMCMFFFS